MTSVVGGFTDPNLYFDAYVHNGQHVNASYGYLKAGVPATVEEYTPLLNELYAVGYDKNSIEVCQDFKF